MEFTIIVLVGGLSVGIIRCAIAKKGNKGKRFKYYNYRKYAIRHKKMGELINIQSKNTF